MLITTTGTKSIDSVPVLLEMCHCGTFRLSGVPREFTIPLQSLQMRQIQGRRLPQQGFPCHRTRGFPEQLESVQEEEYYIV